MSLEAPAPPVSVPPRIGFVEFVALMALMQATVALTIDIVLPSLPGLRQELNVVDPNDAQLVISIFILGLALGPIPFGLAADRFGRRPTALVGLLIFLVGAVMAALAESQTTMLLGRFLQGVGAAGPRTLVMTIVRDRYEGRPMARVMSFVMLVFILAPALAPAIGLGVMAFGGWRAPFVFLVMVGAALALWVAWRLPETLDPAQQRPMEFGYVRHATAVVFSSRQALGAILAQACVFAPFLAYLSSAEQVMGQAYGLGQDFVFAFGAMALCVGAAGLVNGALVMRVGMRRLTGAALVGMLISGLLFAPIAPTALGLSGPLFFVWCAVTLFCFGVLFGNLNALAMQPLGAVAGMGAAIVTTVANLLATPIGVVIGDQYAGDAQFLALGFAVGAGLALMFFWWRDDDGPSADVADDRKVAP